jgi:hypothetical protein
MTLIELRSMAKDHGVFSADELLNQQRLVWAIQRAQGAKPCFRTDERFHCQRYDCMFRADCVKLVAQWKL